MCHWLADKQLKMKTIFNKNHFEQVSAQVPDQFDDLMNF
jgi:hypothetical protein